MSAASRSDAAGLHGVWRLLSFRFENPATGERFEPYGPEPRGTLILDAGGRMAAVITPRDQPRARTDAEQADAFRRMVAYSGRYRLEPPHRFITTVDVAWLPQWIGGEQERSYELNGDMLDIVSAPSRTPHTGDALVVGVLSWMREK